MKANRMILIVLLFVLAFFAPIGAFSLDFFERGEEAFMQNNPDDAIPLLEVAIQNDSQNRRAYMYLGAAYQQLGQYERAVAVYRRALDAGLSNPEEFYYNIALSSYRNGESQLAIDNYTLAVQQNSTYSNAYLNRANMYVRNSEYEKAISDYRLFLQLVPEGQTSETVRRMLVALEDEQVAERLRQEQARIAQEEADRRAEEERILAEQRRAELMQSVLDSLENEAQEN
jgi:tetratricopeptide (TPR) repeat protein